MKKLMFLPIGLALIFSSCNQEFPGLDDQNPSKEVEITFTGVPGGSLKADCNTLADYAMIKIALVDTRDPQIDGDVVLPDFYPSTFIVNTVLYTQAIKLPATDQFHVYKLLEFVLYEDTDNSGGWSTGDEMVSASPQTDSPFGHLSLNPLPVTFGVAGFTKTEVPVELFCIEDENYEDFGFVWFQPHVNILKQKWFFGDFCTKFFVDYEGSKYGNNTAVDMPAIFKIVVNRDNDGDLTNGYEDHIGTYDNEDLYQSAVNGNSALPLGIYFPDRPNEVDNFELEMWIYVKVGNGFDYVQFGSWYFKDNETTLYADEQGGTELITDQDVDGVYDFILGNCMVTSADYAFAPYVNLPESGFMTVRTPDNTGRTSYFELKLTTDADGTSLFDGLGYDFLIDGVVWYESFCFDTYNSIGSTTYEIMFYSSLYPELMPIDDMSNRNWGALNWLANNLEQYPGYTWADLQQACWKIQDPSHNTAAVHAGCPASQNVSPGVTLADQMTADALVHGVNYVPLPGGYAAVSFMTLDPVNGNDHHIQIIFIVVDP